MFVEHERYQREEDDLSTGMRIEPRDAVHASVVHVLVRNPAALTKLLNDSLALVVGELVPYPVADDRAVPDHGHVCFVVVVDVTRAVRVPRADAHHPLARRARIPPITAREIRQCQVERAAHKPPRFVHNRLPNTEERGVVLLPIREKRQLGYFMRFVESAIGKATQDAPHTRSTGLARCAQVCKLSAVDENARMIVGHPTEPFVRARHFECHGIGADLECEYCRGFVHAVRRCHRPAPPVASGLKHSLRQEDGVT